MKAIKMVVMVALAAGISWLVVRDINAQNTRQRLQEYRALCAITAQNSKTDVSEAQMQQCAGLVQSLGTVATVGDVEERAAAIAYHESTAGRAVEVYSWLLSSTIPGAFMPAAGVPSRFAILRVEEMTQHYMRKTNPND